MAIEESRDSPCLTVKFNMIDVKFSEGEFL